MSGDSVVSPLLQYQARLTDPATGEIVADGVYTMTFSLYDVDVGGGALWTETKGVEVGGGVFSTALGDVSPLALSLFQGQALWLGVAVGTDGEATPRQQILPVAYALSLVPGASVVGGSDGKATLYLEHPGDGNAVQGVISSTNSNQSAILGVNHGEGWGVGGASDGVEAAGVLGTNSAGGYGVLGSSSSGNGVRGESESGVGGYFTSTATYGVRGETASTEFGQAGVLGVAGWATTTLSQEAGVLGKSIHGFGVAGVSTNFMGVIGFSNNGYGVRGESTGGDAGVYGGNWGDGYGVHGTSSTSYAGYFYGQNGVYAKATATSGEAYAVYGELDSHLGYGGYFTNTSGYGLFGGHSHPSYTAPAVYAKNTGNGDGVLAYAYSSNSSQAAVKARNYGAGYGVYGYASDPNSYGVYYSGGLAGTGTKSAIVETEDYGWRHLYAQESPGNWFEDFGAAQLLNGQATVSFEPIFAQTVNVTETYHVFVTPLGETPVLLFVTKKAPTGFTVRGVTLDGTAAECAFDYRIVAKRLGYEAMRLEPAEAPPEP
jgi:hypothetical protein